MAGESQLSVLDINIEAERLMIQNTVGNLQAFLVYLFMMVAAVAMGAEMFIMLPRAAISATRINEGAEYSNKNHGAIQSGYHAKTNTKHTGVP